ncbi:MAG: hypothetical protein NTU98_03345 [Bacteroidetes bacterium]|nr:hypothetical protein [Bacteroidota bacterium]
MKTNILPQLLFFFLICFIWSCNKKTESPVPNTTVNLSGELNFKVNYFPADSETVEFMYDNAKRIYTIWVVFRNPYTCSIYSYARNSSGQVTSYACQEPWSEYAIETHVDYSINSDGKYTSATITTYVDGMFYSSGSETYTYTGEFITSIESHQSNQLTQISVFTYDNVGNVTMEKVYNYDVSGTPILNIESTYDNKINPISSLCFPYTVSSGFGRQQFYGKNNVISIRTISGGNSREETFIYTYDSLGKPISAYETEVYNVKDTSHYTSKYIYY